MSQSRGLLLLTIALQTLPTTTHIKNSQCTQGWNPQCLLYERLELSKPQFFSTSYTSRPAKLEKNEHLTSKTDISPWEAFWVPVFWFWTQNSDGPAVGNSCMTGIYFWGSKTVKKRIPEDFFFSCVFRRNFSQECGFGGGLRNSCFLPLSQDFFAGLLRNRNSCIYFVFLWIPPDSSGFLFPPNAVLLWPATKVGFLLSKYWLK